MDNPLHLLWRSLVVLLVLGVPAVVTAQENAEAKLPAGFDPARHMRVDEVEPGMTGYGMTVFHGTQPEPFRVEVVSVERGFEPGKSVVWIRCPDERMQKTGPVQGMSGSPIYLWTDKNDNAKRTPGEGGRLLGAFAFGHRLGKDCYVGVQPIEQMLGAGNRAKRPDGQQQPNAAGVDARDQNLAATWRLARRHQLDEHATWRLAAISKLVGFKPPASDQAPPAIDQAQRMMLPIQVGTPQQVELLQPYFTPLGLSARAMKAGGVGALAPKWIQGDQVKLQAGGVFAIPLVFGPQDLAAIGTCTEVLPDGTALAFGHQMFAQGEIAVPMATGYVHFIQPNLDSSFKLGGSLNITGAVVRDESVAVVGKPGAEFPSLPAKVHVRWPDQPELNDDFDYTMVHHNRLLPALVGMITGSSVGTDVSLPRLNTVRLQSVINFEGGRKLTLNSISPNAAPQNLSAVIVPPLSTLVENPFGTMEVESIDTTLQVQNEVEMAQIVGATLEQSKVKPGDTVVVHVRLQQYRQSETSHRIELKIPEDTPDGQYNLVVSGAQAYSQLLTSMRPHLTRVANEDELFDALQMLMNIRDDALYTVLRLNEINSLAIGRSELPNLPSSRMAMLSVPSSTTTTPYVDSVEHIDQMPYVVSNQVNLPVQIQREQPSN